MTQNFFTFKFPYGSYWENPGFPSLMVPYGAASDFYYSGHTGFFILLIREELIGDKNKKIIMALFLALSYIVTIILLYKVHYTIDVPIGVVAAWTCHTLAEKYTKNIEAILRAFTPRSWKIEQEQNSEMAKHERTEPLL